MRLGAQSTDASTSATWVVPLGRLADEDQASAGSKAVTLGRLGRAGLPVPPGFAVLTTAFKEWIRSSGAADALLAHLDHVTMDQVAEAVRTATLLRETLDAVPVPAAAEAAIVEAWCLRDATTAWAVRSSATAEDLAGASFAGQHETFLNVSGREALLRAVRQCWISLFTDRAVLYRMRQGTSHRSAAMAVVVQEMVPATAAGVLFTADPVSGDTQHLIIEATHGLGDTLVSGRVTPDRFVLDKDTLQVSGRPMNPNAGLNVPQDPAKDSVPGPVTPNRVVPVLEVQLVRRLAELGRRVERVCGGPQDIEWAARNDNLFLLQSRPITALPPPSDAEPDIWTRANAMEAIPGVATPMTWSIMDSLLDGFLNRVLRRFGLETTQRTLVGRIAGRAYINVRVLTELVRGLSGPLPVDFTTAFGGEAAGLEVALGATSRPVSPSFSLRKLGRVLRLAIWLLPHWWHQPRRIAEWAGIVDGDLARTDPATLPDGRLAVHARELLHLACCGAGERTLAAAVWMGITAVAGSTAVFQCARRWLADADGGIANRLLSGAGGMNSAENARELWRLAAWARQHAAVVRILMEPATFAAKEETLSTLPAGREFLQRWQGFMRQNGHQARGGMDVHQPRWSETPDHVLDLLRVYLRMGDEADPLRLQAQRQRDREELLTECRRHLRNPAKRWLFGFLVRISQRGLAQRENVKNEGVRMVAVLRRAFLEAGRRLVDRGVIAAREDVFFLTLEELGRTLSGSPGFDVAATLASRKIEYARQQTLTPPTLIIGRYDPDRVVPEAVDPHARVLKGLAVSPGVVTGPARVILQADTEERVLPGEILVAPYTDPGWTVYFLPAAALVVDVGGQLSHGSVVAREYGLPAVVNVGPATRIIKTGQPIRVDGNRGLVTILDPANADG